MAETRLEKGEIKILLALSVFSIMWIAVAIPFITTNSFFTSLNPVFAYALFNLGFIILTSITFGTVFAILKHNYDIWSAFSNGIVVWLSFSWVIDMYQPPYFLDMQGNEIISNVSTGANASVDAMWAFAFNSLVPSLKPATIPFLNISLLFIAVYGFVPLMTVLIAAYVLTEGQLVKFIGIGNDGSKGVKK